jgi:hypothetical protein
MGAPLDPHLRSRWSYFLPLGFRCDRSLPATDFVPFGTLGLLRSFPALDASFLLVATSSPPRASRGSPSAYRHDPPHPKG